MKKGYWWATLMACFLCVASANARADLNVGEDKVQHAIAGGVIGIGAAIIADGLGVGPADRRLTGFLAGCAAGFAKEAYDKHRGGRADPADILATCLGATISYSISF